MSEYQVDWTPANGALNPRDLRDGFGTFATGVTIITAAAPDGSPVGCTASSFNSVSLDPPLVLWSLALTSLSLDVYRTASHFAVNVLALDQADLAMKFAKSDPNKFASVAYRRGAGDAPLIDGSMAQFECRTEAQVPGGDHVVFIGRVEGFRWRAAAPLLFFRGAFPRLRD